MQCVVYVKWSKWVWWILKKFVIQILKIKKSWLGILHVFMRHYFFMNQYEFKAYMFNKRRAYGIRTPPQWVNHNLFKCLSIGNSSMNILSSFVHTYVISNLYDFQRMGKKNKKKNRTFFKISYFFCSIQQWKSLCWFISDSSGFHC